MDTAYDQNATKLNEILPDEFINSLTSNSLPQNKLNLKINAVAYLLHNLNINAG